MKLDKIFDYCKENDIIPEFVKIIGNSIVVRDPRCNDLSKPGFALAYDFTCNAVTFTKVDSIEQKLIFDDTTTGIMADEVKTVKTFLNFVSSLNKYCKIYNCDYKTALNEKSIIPHTVNSQYNNNQRIVYDKANKRIIFLAISKTYFLQLDKIFSDFIDKEDNFDEFVKESFEFCKKNECSFENYAANIAGDMLKFKYSLSGYAKTNPKEKLLYTFFDKDSKTGFAYCSDNAIKAFTTFYNYPICFEIDNQPQFLLESNEELKIFIEYNRTTIIDGIVNKINIADAMFREYKDKEKLNGLIGAMGAFRGNYRKK